MVEPPTPDPGPIRWLWSRTWKWVLIIGAVGSFVSAILLFKGAISSLFVDSEPITVGFNTLDGCQRGRLEAHLETGYLREVDALIEGASALTICDTEELTAVPGEIGRQMADRYKGCLSYSDHAGVLSLIPNPEAVCRFDDGSGVRYFCDGQRPEARIRQVSSRLVDRTALPTCSEDFLKSVRLIR